MEKKLKLQKILKYAKKIILLNNKGGVCQNCQNNNIFQLTFHHIDKNNKDFEFGESKNYRLSKIKNELDKCIILCQNCHREHHYNEDNNERSRSKLIYLEYGGSECVKCGYNKCPASLTFHHRDPNEKEFSIGSISERFNSIYDLSKLIKDEINKCDVLCANCHVLEHSDINFYNKYKHEIYSKVINYKEKQHKIDRDLVIKMYNEGKKQIDIAKHFSASNGTISDIIKKYKNELGIKYNRVNKEDVIKMYSEGKKQIDIAKHFNVSRSTINYIIKNSE